MQVKDEADLCGPEAKPGYWINRTSRLLVRRGDTLLRSFGLALSYLPVLRALGERGALSQKELAKIAGVEQPSMAETLLRMERDGVVQREPNPDDKRGSLVSITRRARARFPKAMAELVEGERQAMAGLDDAEQVMLRDLLRRVARNLEPPIERAGAPSENVLTSRPAHPPKRRSHP